MLIEEKEKRGNDEIRKCVGKESIFKKSEITTAWRLFILPTYKLYK